MLDDISKEILDSLQIPTVKKKKKSISSKLKSEEYVQERIVTFLTNKHPNIEFSCGTEGVRMNVGMVMKLKKLGIIRKSNPDIKIYEPIGKYHGLMLELKRDKKSLFKKNGELRSSKHLQEQEEKLKKFRDKGYCALFCGGFEEAMKTIEDYLQGRL